MKSWLAYLKKALARKLPEDRVAGKNKTSDVKGHLKNLWPFVLRHWQKGIIGFSIIFFSSLLAYPQPLITRFLIDNVLIAKKLNLLAVVVLLLTGIKLLEMGAKIFQRFYFLRFEQEIIIDIQHDILNRILHFPKAFFDNKETGYLMSRLTSDIKGLRWFFSSTIVSIITNALRFIAGIGLLLYLEWRVALTAILLLPALGFFVRFFSRKVRILSHQSMEHNANVFRHMQESLSSIPLIKSFVSEKREIGNIMHELKSSQGIALERTALDSLANLSVNSVKEIARFVVLIAGGILIIRGQWSVGSLLAFQAYLNYVYDPATFFANTNFSFQSALASLERLAAFYDILPEENKSKGYHIKHLSGEIEFRDVSFSYNGQEKVLKNLSFSIESGERIAIVGPSGVGKTTLISLILGFYRPTEGEILFDNRPLTEYALDSLRMRIGYVSQGTRLLSRSIMENLKYGNPEAGEEKIIAASKAAGIHDFIINSTPEGYATLLGENGLNLSEGQRQRLSIARALIKDPDILLLDEPTSSQDSLIEKSIFKSIPGIARNKTRIVIAHRLSTIKNSNRILVLKDKQLIATGTHQTLIENCDFYRSLVENQRIAIMS